MTSYTCPKCNGSGHLARHAAIADGVCFSCAGRGFKLGKAPIPGVLFTVTAVQKTTNERVTVCGIKAKTAEEAQAKAVSQLSRGTGYIPESAQVGA